MVGSSLLVALALSFFLWGRPVWGRVQLLYWQARCMRYQTPEGTIASSSDRPAVVSVEWTNFFRLTGGGSTVKSDGTVFLHERTSAAGKRRLVAVNMHDLGCFGGRAMVARVFAPASLFSRAREIASDGPRPVEFATTIYAGTSDPADASHFVIKYDSGTQTHVIDGWLTDEDRVLLEERRPAVACLTP